jgi:hypothetical protein
MTKKVKMIRNSSRNYYQGRKRQNKLDRDVEVKVVLSVTERECRKPFSDERSRPLCARNYLLSKLASSRALLIIPENGFLEDPVRIERFIHSVLLKNFLGAPIW